MRPRFAARMNLKARRRRRSAPAAKRVTARRRSSDSPGRARRRRRRRSAAARGRRPRGTSPGSRRRRRGHCVRRRRPVGSPASIGRGSRTSRLRRTETAPSRGASCSSGSRLDSSTFWCMMVSAMPVYLDCAATTPLDPRVRAEMLRYLDEDFGNAGSRTHELGRRARTAVEHARDRVAAVVGERPRGCDFHQRRDGKQQSGDSRAGRSRGRQAPHRVDGDRAPRRARTARGAGPARVRRHARRSRPGRRRGSRRDPCGASSRHAACQHDARQQRDRGHSARRGGRRSARTARRPICTSMPRRALPGRSTRSAIRASISSA